jgi:cysteinyl-tRNA synthetase
MLNLYNSLSKTIEAIAPDKPVNLYSCGPTVYNFAHIGNLRSFICADVLFRTLRANNYHVRWVMNITDIDDKTIKATIAEYGSEATIHDLRTVTERFYQAFLEDLKKVGVATDSIQFIRVTDAMSSIIEFVKKLLELGFAYRADDGSTYFSIQKYQEAYGDYGALMGEKFMEGKKINARIANDEYQKDDLSDFALWKAHSAEDAQIFWNDPELGPGRPGWHIECSAVNWQAFNGETTTIHTGGVDLRFPHHTNEIAQSAPLYPSKKFTEHWFHSEHLLVDGKKMSKSLGNFYTLRDLEEKGYDGSDFRNFVLAGHYRAQQNFSFKALDSIKIEIENLGEKAWNLEQLWDKDDRKPDENKLTEFKEYILHDLGTPQARAAIHLYLSDKNFNYPTFCKMIEIAELDLKKGVERAAKIFAEVALHPIPSSIEKMRQQRDLARTSKNWPESDRLRTELEELGYTVEDTKDGTKLHKK